jgi:hypothetical protein
MCDGTVKVIKRSLKGKVIPVLNQLNTMPWRLGEWKYSFTILDLTSRCSWVVSFTPRTLYSGERAPRYPLDRRLSGARNRSGRCGEKKDLCPAGIEPGFFSPYPVAIPTELSRLCPYHLLHIFNSRECLLPLSWESIIVPSVICRNTAIKLYRTAIETVNITVILNVILSLNLGLLEISSLEHLDPHGGDWLLLTSPSEQEHLLPYPRWRKLKTLGTVQNNGLVYGLQHRQNSL